MQFYFSFLSQTSLFSCGCLGTLVDQAVGVHRNPPTSAAQCWDYRHAPPAGNVLGKHSTN